MTSTEIARTDEGEWDDTGLEDFDSRISMPRLNIVHPDGVFTSAQTSENFTVLNGIALGLVKQRAMFHPEMGKDVKLKPQCKSQDAETGYPTMKGGEKDLFPWNEVPFKVEDLARDEFGRPTISCKTCPLSQWGTNKKPPRCAERHAYPLLFSDDENWQPGDDMPHRGIVTFQKSGIKPSNQFLAFFKTAKRPVYGNYVTIRLLKERSGMITYSVPKFTRLNATPTDDWPELSSDYRGIREFLRQPPRPSDEESGTTATATSVIDSAATASTATTAAATADPWASGDDDELPF